MKMLNNGDRVEWNTSKGRTKGKVIEKLTKPTDINNYTAKASKTNPQYKVETVKSHKIAIHKPDSLKKI